MLGFTTIVVQQYNWIKGKSTNQFHLVRRRVRVNKKKTYLCNVVSPNKLAQWHSIATNSRCDICNVGLNNIAKLCAFILLNFSFCITESRWISIHASSVLFAVGSWLMRFCSSRSCCVTWGKDAASSNRVVKSVVKIGSGSSLKYYDFFICVMVIDSWKDSLLEK